MQKSSMAISPRLVSGPNLRPPPLATPNRQNDRTYSFAILMGEQGWTTVVRSENPPHDIDELAVVPLPYASEGLCTSATSVQ